MVDNTIRVTSPLLPDLEEFQKLLGEIWDSRWITNNGTFHQRLEEALATYLKVPYISLFTNGTLPLLTALQALDIKGEVITTPYSFVATSHSLWWNGLRPVFVDVNPDTFNMDVGRIEAAVTEATTAIMPVHCYGYPCDVEGIAAVAERYGLKVIYDAAHAFGVEKNGRSILEYGDLSALSFHATKVYNTVEGGALVCHSQDMKRKIDHLKNFGFSGETSVEGVGINGKMDELRAAYGLLNLRKVDIAISERKRLAERYRDCLRGVPGLRVSEDCKGVKHNYSHFPLLVDADVYGMSRDDLYALLKRNNIYARRYFYPLITDFTPYSKLDSASGLEVARRLSSQVICLPLYYGLSDEDQQRIIEIIISR